MGLIERDGPTDQYRHIISLEEAGIEVPEPRDPEPEEEANGTEDSESDEEPQEEAQLTDYDNE